ncbi:MAG: ribonuclease P protein component [Gammaproteobacteria bacterium]|nr:ribonuclease P protein component [Gammaproteobacteria bacterium]
MVSIKTPVSYRTEAFPKSLRLTEASEYRKVFDSAQRSADNSFLVLARENSLSVARLGLAVSKKNLRLAVQRNYIKRVIRESFRRHLKELSGIDIVVLAQKKILQQNSNELNLSIETHWERIVKCIKS